jgi:hypothetical protein
VSGDLVYINHGEENPEGAPIGRVVCLDASQIDPEKKKPKVVWDTYRRKYKANGNKELATRFGLASAALADGFLYVPDDNGALFCFRAKDGELLWKYRYATEVRGAPLVADGKLYIFDVKGKLLILTLKGNEKPDEDETFDYRFPGPGGLLNETTGTPIAVNGRIYFTTRTDLFCLGDPSAKVEEVKYAPLPAETPFKQFAMAGARLFPAEVSAKPGGTVKFEVVYFDENGRPVMDNRPSPAPKWTLPEPPLPKGAAKPPPPLQGTIALNGELTLAPLPAQQGYVDYDGGGPLKARARVRVVPQIPYSQNFDNIPTGAAPAGWINATGKYFVKKLDDGSIVLSKVNTDSRPPIAKANTYITGTDSTDYTIQCEMQGTKVRGQMPDMGLVNCRYTCILDGKPYKDTGKRTIQLISWDPRPRLHTVEIFDWQPDTWYNLKFTVVQTPKEALLKAKVWKKGDAEPEKWTIEFADPSPNRNGAAGIYGYVANVVENDTNCAIYYDNLMITPK